MILAVYDTPIISGVTVQSPAPANSVRAPAGSLKDSAPDAQTGRRGSGIGPGKAVGRQTLKRPCVRSRESLRPPSQRDERHAGQAIRVMRSSGLGGVTNAENSAVYGTGDHPGWGDLCLESCGSGIRGREPLRGERSE